MEKHHLSKSVVGIKVVESRCPQNDVWRKVWCIQAGTKVRLYVGSVKPTLPMPTLSQIPMYWEMWDNELNIEIIAADARTLAYWEYFRELSLDYIAWSRR
jgi:hypothetical protein